MQSLLPKDTLLRTYLYNNYDNLMRTFHDGSQRNGEIICRSNNIQSNEKLGFCNDTFIKCIRIYFDYEHDKIINGHGLTTLCQIKYAMPDVVWCWTCPLFAISCPLFAIRGCCSILILRHIVFNSVHAE